MVTRHQIRVALPKLPVFSKSLIKRLYTERKVIMLRLRQLDELGLFLASHEAINLVKSADTLTEALFVR